MKLSARARYAVRLLLDLAQNRGEVPIRASILSENTAISVQFIEQILRPLKKAGFIKSVRGASGGHILLAEPDELPLGDILRTMEGRIKLSDCCADPGTCSRSDDCRTRVVWDHISKVIEHELDCITLADLMKDPDSIISGDRVACRSRS